MIWFLLQLQKNLGINQEEVAKINMEVNEQKTTIIIIAPSEQKPKIQLNGYH